MNHIERLIYTVFGILLIVGSAVHVAINPRALFIPVLTFALGIVLLVNVVET